MTSRRSDRGASTLEFVLTMPALLLMLMVIVQTVLVFHGQSIAQAAADEGAARARAYNGTPAAGRTGAEHYIDALSGGMFTSHNVTVSRTAESAEVTVRAQVASLVPGLSPSISRTSSGPVERFVDAP